MPPAAGLPNGVWQDQAPSEKPIYKRVWFLAIAGFVALLVVISALGSLGGGGSTQAGSAGTTSSSSTTTPPTQKATKAAKTPTRSAPSSTKGPGVGDKVRDGKFEFTVTSVKCGIKKVGNAYLSTKAQGQFCAVDVKVSNIGDEAQSMFANNQYAFDAQGRKFSADSEASIYDEDSQVLWEEVNPGNSVEGTVYFDIPVSDTLNRLELHDSVFSGGVDVDL